MKSISLLGALIGLVTLTSFSASASESACEILQREVSADRAMTLQELYQCNSVVSLADGVDSSSAPTAIKSIDVCIATVENSSASALYRSRSHHWVKTLALIDNGGEIISEGNLMPEGDESVNYFRDSESALSLHDDLQSLDASTTTGLIDTYSLDKNSGVLNVTFKTKKYYIAIPVKRTFMTATLGCERLN